MNIVQIGTNRAYDNMSSIVHKYSVDNICKLIMVEPFSYHNLNIKKCYEKYINKLYIENIIITPEIEHKGKENIWYHELDATHGNAYELASLNKEHASYIRSNYDTKDMKSLEIACLNINELFEKYDIYNIDILYIDTEGFDDKLIYSINFNKFLIKQIFYENLHIDANQLRKFLMRKNYKVFESISEDSYADRAELCHQ